MMYNSILQTTNNKIPTTVGGSIYCSGDQYTAWGINIGLGGSIKNSGVSTSFSIHTLPVQPHALMCLEPSPTKVSSVLHYHLPHTPCAHCTTTSSAVSSLPCLVPDSNQPKVLPSQLRSLCSHAH